MRAGRLRDRVTFQVLSVPSKDSTEGGRKVWSNLCTVWGELRLERGVERVEAGRLESSVAGVLIVRSSGATRAITAVHRAVIRGEAYQIRSNTNPDRRRIMQEMVVEAGVGQ